MNSAIATKHLMRWFTQIDAASRQSPLPRHLAQLQQAIAKEDYSTAWQLIEVCTYRASRSTTTIVRDIFASSEWQNLIQWLKSLTQIAPGTPVQWLSESRGVHIRREGIVAGTIASDEIAKEVFPEVFQAIKQKEAVWLGGHWRQPSRWDRLLIQVEVPTDPRPRFYTPRLSVVKKYTQL